MKKIFFIKNNNISNINNYIYNILIFNKLINCNIAKVEYNTINGYIHYVTFDNFLNNIDCSMYSSITFNKIKIINLNTIDINTSNLIMIHIFFDENGDFKTKDINYYCYCYDNNNINNFILDFLKKIKFLIEYI